MTDTIKDSTLIKAYEEGRIFGEGAVLEDHNTKNLLKNLNRARENNHGPKTETLKVTSEMEITDARRISENKITDLISEEWGETPDTLVPMVRIDTVSDNKNNDGLIITEVFDSTVIPEGVEKVSYQFARKGKYGDGEYLKTEIYRFEFKKLDPFENRSGAVFEPSGTNDEKMNLSHPQPEDNQFVDTESGLLVTYYKIPVN